MNSNCATPTLSRDLPGCQASEITVSQLVADVYSTAPASDRSRLLEYLLRPLGVLALVAIADGIFAKIRFRSGWPDLHVALEDANRVQAGDIAVLVDRVQQVSSDAVDGLAGIVSASPVLASSAAAAVLVAVLVQHARMRSAARAASDSDPDFEPPNGNYPVRSTSENTASTAEAPPHARSENTTGRHCDHVEQPGQRLARATRAPP